MKKLTNWQRFGIASFGCIVISVGYLLGMATPTEWTIGFGAMAAIYTGSRLVEKIKRPDA